MPNRDYYEQLGVPRNATADEIKSAFRKRARECHPDLHPNDKRAEERFKEINAAYEVLSNSEKRAMYDRYATAAPENGGSGYGAPEYEAATGASYQTAQEAARAWAESVYGNGTFDFESIFEEFFGSNWQRNRRTGQQGARRETMDLSERDMELFQAALSLGRTNSVDYEAKTENYIIRCEKGGLRLYVRMGAWSAERDRDVFQYRDVGGNVRNCTRGDYILYQTLRRSEKEMYGGYRIPEGFEGFMRNISRLGKRLVDAQGRAVSVDGQELSAINAYTRRHANEFGMNQIPLESFGNKLAEMDSGIRYNYRVWSPREDRCRRR